MAVAHQCEYWADKIKMHDHSRTRFFTISTQRSGSTWLTDLLNSNPDIASYTELFLLKGDGTPDWGMYKDMVYWQTYRIDLQGIDKYIRPFGVFRYLDESLSRHPDKRAVGLKLMYTQIVHWPETLLYLKIRDLRVIHLIRRNVLDVVLSSLARASRKSAHAHQGDAVERVRIQVEPNWLLRQLIKRRREQHWFAYLLSHLGVPYLEVIYEDIVYDQALLSICLEYLGCTNTILDSKLTKMNPSRHDELIENIAEVAAALRGTRFSKMLRA